MRKRLTALTIATGILAAQATQAHAPMASAEQAGTWHKLFQAEEPDPEDLRCLALNIYWESRAEPEEGQVAVAHVTLNRLNDPRFPRTICGVVTQGGSAGPCQFSWYCDGRDDTPVNQPVWERTQALARAVLQGRIPDPTGGALYFHNHRIRPTWASTKDGERQIGQHVFFNLASSS